MNTKEINYNYFGILGSVDWNSNQWKGRPTDEDILKSGFAYTIETKVTYTFLNFDIDKYEDSEMLHSGLVPHIHSRNPVPEKKSAVKIVFIWSKSYHDKQTYIVGYYLFPEIKNHKTPSNFPQFCDFMEYCIKSKVKHINMFQNPVNINNDCNLNELLPKKRSLGKMGYNYLSLKNVEYLMKIAMDKNPHDQKLKSNFNQMMIFADKNRLLTS